MKLYILGLGAGRLDLISKKAYELLKDKDKQKIFRTQRHDAVYELEKEGVEYQSLDDLYEKNATFENVYENIASLVIEAIKSTQEDVVYAVPGNPFVMEDSTYILLEKAKKENIEVEVIPSLSFVDASICALNIDPSKNLYITEIFSLDIKRIHPQDNVLISQVYDRLKASDLKLQLMEKYQDEQEVYIIRGAGTQKETVKKVLLYELDHKENTYDHMTSIFIEGTENKKYQDIEDLKLLIQTLRGENGCPWDKKQTFDSMKKYVLEETQELIEAIEKKDIENLCEELGDVLFQIVFLANLAQEKMYFDLNEVIGTVTSKMIRRHPHVFSEKKVKEEEIEKMWEEIKREEKKKNIDK